MSQAQRQQETAEAERGGRRRLIAEAIMSHYGLPGELLEGWSAEPAGEGTFRVRNDQGQERVMRLGDRFQDGSRLARHESGHLMRSGAVIPLGKNINPRWHARRTREGFLLISREREEPVRHVAAEEVTEHPGGEGEPALIEIDGETILIAPRDYKLQLLVFDGAWPFEARDPLADKDSQGYYAVFVRNDGAHTQRRGQGVVGVFHPAGPGRQGPARFCELGEDGVLANTVRFFAREGGHQRVFAIMRDSEIAREEAALRIAARHLNSLRHERGEAVEGSLAALHQRIEDYDKIGWSFESFSVKHGLEHFLRTAPARERHRESEAEAGAEPPMAASG